MNEVRVRQNNPEFRSSLRRVIPLLQVLPGDLYRRLDLAELALPMGRVAALRGSLEQELGSYVVTYWADTFRQDIPVDSHLCANIAGAELTPAQLRRLQESEQITKQEGVTLVAYKKPLQVIQPDQSWVYRFYQENGLLLPASL